MRGRGAASLAVAGILAWVAPAWAQAPAPSPSASPSAPRIRWGGNVTLRQDDTELQDKPDLLLGDNQIAGLRARVRFWVESDEPEQLVGGGIRWSTGENANPTSPFIRLGDGFRSQNFWFDRYYLVVRPFHKRDAAVLSAGKIPLPFWRGDRGYFRTEMVWDDDISPVGITLQDTFYKSGGESGVKVDNTLGYFALQEVQDDRFAGLVSDTYMIADQLHVQAHLVSAAVTYYDYEHLDAGLRSPSFVPGESAFLLPGTSAFLLRPPLQVTNNEVEYGPGAHGFLKDSFRIVDVTAQVHVPFPWFKSTGSPEVFLLGEYAHNFEVPAARDGYAVSVGLRGGGWKDERLHPYGAHFTWRDVDEDAAIGAFADSDLGAGTGVRGIEASANYRLARNLQLTGFFFKYRGAPFKDNHARRLFIDLTWDF